MVGLAAECSALSLRSNNHSATNQTLEILGQSGDIIGDELYGYVKNPSCDYAITSKGKLTGILLGKVYNAPYALSSISISTSAGGEPTVSCNGVQIETGATQSVCTYALDEIDLTPARHALTFGAFTYTESKALTLQSSDFEASVELSPTTINGDPVASDSVKGVETVSITMWSAIETTEPVIVPNEADGWHITTGWTCTGADSSLFTWTCTLTKYLTSVEGQ